MILVLSGLFMIAEGLGYELVAVDDDEDGESSTAQESEMDA
ncbi:hypothetical protein [Halorhabdus sp. CBA1104]|nr:hypothetical protein [Halorhabdus sp. CBA1104]